MDLRPKQKFFSAAIGLMMLSLTTSAAMAAQVTGAIFTTLVDGSSVNHNIYNAKQDVYSERRTEFCQRSMYGGGTAEWGLLLSSDRSIRERCFCSDGRLEQRRRDGAGRCIIDTHQLSRHMIHGDWQCVGKCAVRHACS